MLLHSHPEGPGRHAPVILLMDAPGIREELRHMARRIAARGYFCLLPDLYYRLGQLRFDIARRNEAMSVVIRARHFSGATRRNFSPRQRTPIFNPPRGVPESPRSI